MSDLLSIGASGTRVYQRALSTISTNISNAENPNYVRRDLRLGELSITQGFDPYHNVQIRFGGVDIGGVARAHAPFLEANARYTGASLYDAETSERWMGAIETALGDGEHGVGQQLTSVFTAAEELSAAPFDTVLRSQFVANIDASVSKINRTASNLLNLSEQIAGAAEQEIKTLNEALGNLANINLSLRGSVDGSTKQATLLDQRDTALAVITERLNVNISFAHKGMTNIQFDGQQLIQVGEMTSISVQVTIDGSLQFFSNGSVVSAPTQGPLSALMSSAATNSQRRTELDALANQLAGEVNTWQSLGTTDSGLEGTPLLDATGGAAGLTMLSRDPSDLALAASGGAANGNILNFSSLRGENGAENTWSTIVGNQGVITASAQSERAAASSQHQAAREARDNLSSVDLDREASDLIRFQQAYDASARVIQVARETMQSIFAIF